MQNAGAQVLGIDMEPVAIDYARKFYPGPEYRLEDVREHDGEHDCVVSFETIEHMKDPELALTAFRKSRELIVSTPNEQFYPFRPASYVNDKYPHVRHYLPHQLDALLASCGWSVVSRHCQPTKKSEVVHGTDGMFMVYVCR